MIITRNKIIYDIVKCKVDDKTFTFHAQKTKDGYRVEVSCENFGCWYLFSESEITKFMNFSGGRIFNIKYLLAENSFLDVSLIYISTMIELGTKGFTEKVRRSLKGCDLKYVTI